MKDKPYRFVIQDTANRKYLLHIDSGIDHPYEDTNTTEEATKWSTLEHVAYVLWWYVDLHREYQIVNLDTNEVFMKDKQRGIPHVMSVSK
ncbi:hypothetical protein [Paenibacillus polymyxa]|uniref:hypothetical protein n=1 Tax=Paenibacillus polymyxa TaxID=1406 RepID=UPI002AB5CE38|nr:hypothetical protein [Paenibacillus polymyxa]MDY8021124.1 hypothetical protein [Paenibacillus polymyxa]